MPVLFNLFVDVFIIYLAYKGWVKLRGMFAHKDEYMMKGKSALSDYLREEIQKGVAAELDRRDKENK